MTNAIIRPLETQAEINQARHLLFQVYYREMSWRPAVDNPSGLRLEIANEGVMLVDDFDNEATWFGCFINDELIACNRLLKGQTKGYEVEKYCEIPAEFRRDGSYELNRLAVLKEHRAGSVFLLLMAEQMTYLAARNSKYVFSTAPIAGVGALYVKTGMKVYDMAPFKYETKDPLEVSFLYYDFTDTATLSRLVNLARRAGKGQAKRA